MNQLFSGLALENVCPNRSSEGKAQRGHTAEPQVCLSGALPPEKGLASLTKGCPLSLELSCRWVACTSVLPSVPDAISLLKFRPSLCLRTPPHSPGQFFLVLPLTWCSCLALWELALRQMRSPWLRHTHVPY